MAASPHWLGHPGLTGTFSAGGSRGTKTDTWSTTQAWCFPLAEAAWRPVAPMLKARTNHASAALNGEVYVVGGEAARRALLSQTRGLGSQTGVPSSGKSLGCGDAQWVLLTPPLSHHAPA